MLTCRDQIPVYVASESDGNGVDELPYPSTDFHHPKPFWERLTGWSEDITKAKTLDGIPKNIQAHVKAISVRPGRTESVEINSFL